MAPYSIAHGRTAEHAAELKRGLERLPQGFVAVVCDLCKGAGQYRQMFTAGCGRGYYQAMSGCDYCDGTGLMQGRVAAPASVREQVLNAARS